MPTQSLVIWGATLIVALGSFAYLFLRDGYKASFFTPLLWFVPPLLVMPFAYSDANERAVPLDTLDLILLEFPRATWMFCAGTVACFAGILAGRLSGQRLGFGALDYLAEATERFAESGFRLTALVGLQLVVYAYLVFNGMQFGTGTALAFENTAIRPILSAWVVLNTFLIVILSVRAIGKPDLFTLASLAILFLLAFATGQRGQSILVVVPLFLIFANARRMRTLVTPALLLLLLVPIAALQTFVRARLDPASDGTIQFTVLDEFLYGNQFSDVRDLAWMLSGFDGHLLGGKTYLAGYTPFIPSFISTFRQQWGWGRWSTEAVHLDPEFHGGLRGGMFGELYFNFGFVPMVAGALVVGLLLGRTIAWESDRRRQGDDAQAAVASGTAFFVGSIIANLVFTPGFFVALIFSALLVVG